MSKKYIMLGALIMVVIVGVLFYKLTGTSRLVKQYEDKAKAICQNYGIELLDVNKEDTNLPTVGYTAYYLIFNVSGVDNLSDLDKYNCVKELNNITIYKEGSKAVFLKKITNNGDNYSISGQRDNLLCVNDKEVFNYATSLNKYSIEYRLEIHDYIESQYQYYDAIEGKNVGDKYSETIWKEAEEKYGVDKKFIDEQVWGNSEVMKADAKSKGVIVD